MQQTAAAVKIKVGLDLKNRAGSKGKKWVCLMRRKQQQKDVGRGREPGGPKSKDGSVGQNPAPSSVSFSRPVWMLGMNS